MDYFQSIIAAFYFVFGAIFLFLAFTVVKDNLSQRLNRTAGMMLFFAALGPVFLALGTIITPNLDSQAPFEESFIYNLHYIWELFFPAFLLFSLVYPIDRLSRFRRQRLKYLIFLPHIFHISLALGMRNPERVLNLLEIESGQGVWAIILEPLSYVLKWVVLGFSLLLTSEGTLFAVVNLIYVFLAVGFLIHGRSLISNRQLRARTIMVVVGITLAVGLYAAAYLFPAIFAYAYSPTVQTLLLVAALIFGGGGIVWSVIREQFLDIRIIVRQSLVYTISSGLLVGLYLLVIEQGGKFISGYFGGKTTILNIAFIVAALILFQPISTRLDNLIRRLFLKRGSDYRNVMEQLSRRLITILETEQLRQTIEKTIQSTLMVERVYFVLYDDKLKEYVLLSTEDFPERMIIDRNDLFLGGVNQLTAPAAYRILGIYHGGSSLAVEMDKRHIEMILPLKDANHLLGFLALSAKSTGFRFNANDINFLGVLSNQLVTALTNTRLYADSLEKQRLDEEMTMARQIQLDLLPKEPPRGGNYKIVTYSQPSRIIGGDFFDFITITEDRFGIVIADASGKGMPAALMVAQIQATLRAEAGNNRDIGKIIGNVNRHLALSSSSEKYATLFYGEFDHASCTFSYTNAGHNYPLLIRKDGSFHNLSEGGIVIGVFPNMNYKCSDIHLEPDDLIFFYTDGVSEAMNEKDEEYGEARIRDFVVNRRHLDPDDILKGILDDIRGFDSSDPPRDDTTIVVMKLCSKGK